MRLITRADLDGLVSAVFITLMEEIEEILFAEPNILQNGLVEVKPWDIIANLPYHPNCSLWFDHHVSNQTERPFRGLHRLAPSAARVIYEYYQDKRLAKYERMLKETDRIDSADLRQEETIDPQGYLLLAMTIDGKYEEDRAYWMRVITLLRDHPIEEILLDPEVFARCKAFREAQKVFEKVLRAHSRCEDRIILTDFRDFPEPPVGNRFLVYTMFPDGLVSLKLANDPTRTGVTAISLGKNIFDKSFPINVGTLLASYGGGGHGDVGSCRVPHSKAEGIIKEMIAVLKQARSAHQG